MFLLWLACPGALTDEGNVVVKSPRTGLLLGAGASFDAGLPLTFQLAETVVRQTNSVPPGRLKSSSGAGSWVAALNFVYGSMMGHQSENGGNPLEAVNIERLISALRLLQEVEGHEAAPFVMTWKPSVHSLGSPTFTGSDLGRAGDRLMEALSPSSSGRRSAFAGRNVESAVAEISKAAISASRGDRKVFKQAEDAILEELVQILSAVSSVDYLEPVARLAQEQEGGLDILTLNYDLVLETLARDSKVNLVTGIENWQPGTPLSFSLEDARINLLKMHGSLNWQNEGAGSPTEPVRISVRTDEDGEKDDQWNWRRPVKPWIVVGDREKLATDGPTLYLYAAAQEMLSRTNNLVVIGYGFADKHVNNLIRDWMLSDDDRTITLLDPSLQSLVDRNDFRAALIRAYGVSKKDLGSRIGIVPKGARDGLVEALRYQYPPPISRDEYFTVLPRGDEDRYSIARIVCDGPSVSNVQVSVSVGDDSADETHASPVDAGTSESDLHDKLQRQRSYGRGTFYATLGPIEHGKHQDVFFPRKSRRQIVFALQVGRPDAPYGFFIQKTVFWPAEVDQTRP
ncbi:SIR2 family protein [Serinicoccus sediminis]|uniref:SIR2 family protein n=1 Tax=Serinicoccus sediminis TaxID=2306021 RepID=UPI0010202F8B|nr:SIR2 family protein [Serinicoccus sediminis]